MPAVAPFIRVMHRVRGRLDEVNMPVVTGIADLSLRWARNRYTTREERPCLAIAFVSDEPADDGSVNTNSDELVRVLALDLICDMEIETEASAEANESMGTPIEEFDPAGLGQLSMVITEAHKALRECCIDPLQDTTELGRCIDWVQDIGYDDDEELAGEDGRLVGRLNVIYRTSSWDPTLLLERT